MLNKDFVDAFRAFLEAEAEFLVVGAFAVAVHAEPRATGDLDLWVNPTPENASKVWKALVDFGAPLHDLTLEDLSNPGIVFQMGLPPNRIDVITVVSGLTFAEAWRSRTSFEVEGLKVPVIGREALLKNKRAAGRPKDLLDADLIERNRAPSK